MPSAARTGTATIAELMRLSDDGQRVELIAGEIVHKATPTPEHGVAQIGLGEILSPFRRRGGGGGGGPGGWWLMSEVEVAYATGDVFRHDAVGYRREQHPSRPQGTPVRERPDWVAEILSPSTARYDLGDKMRTLRAAGVPHYWIVDPEHEILTVHRWTAEGYIAALSAGVGDVVRAEPFDVLPISIAALFGRDES